MAILYRNTTHEVEMDSALLTYNSPNFRGFELAVTGMNAVVPVSTVTLTPVEANKWNYQIVLKDGRTWNQTIRRQTTGSRPGFYQTFDVSDEWRLDEFVPGRAIREALQSLIEQDNVTNARCEYF